LAEKGSGGESGERTMHRGESCTHFNLSLVKGLR